MRNISFLLFTLLLVQETFAFTVVLKSGKRVEGTRIGEDPYTIQLKDANGLVLSFRKSTVDETGTAEANPPEVVVSSETERAQKRSQTIVEIAEEARRTRTGNARLLTNMDLEDLPEISVLNEYDPSRVAVRNDEGGTIPSKEERYWRTTSASLKRELSLLREKQIDAREDCLRAREKKETGKTGPHAKPVDFLVLMEDPVDCRRLAEIERRLHEAQSRHYDFEERARRAQVPWQWIE